MTDVVIYTTLPDGTRIIVDTENPLPIDPSGDFNLSVSEGGVAGKTLNQAFGCNPNIGTTYEVISTDGVYRMPTTAQALEILSSDTNDTSAGTGARTVLVSGLDGNFVQQVEFVTMNGTTAVALANTYIRLASAIVATSGIYAQDTTGSHAGNITIRASGGGDTWATIALDGFATSSTSMAAFTVPSGFTAQVYGAHFDVDSNKVAAVSFVFRPAADTVAAPFGPSFIPLTLGAISGFQHFTSAFPVGVFPPKTDIWIIGKFGSGAGRIDATMEMLLTEVP